MYDNRWDNWAGDFADSFDATLLDPSVRGHVSDILTAFGDAARASDPEFPDALRPGTLSKIVTEALPRLALPEPARPHAPEVVASFLAYLQETGRLGEGDDWAAQVRALTRTYRERLKPGGVKGVTVQRPVNVTPLGRNDPCPCGSGKKYKKCCKGE